MAEAVLFVELTPTSTGVKRSIEKDLNGAFQESEKAGNGFLDKIGKGVGLAVAGVAAGFTALAVKGGFDRALKIDEAQAKLRGLGNDTAAVDKIMANALASVRGTAFSLDAAATTAAGAVAAGIAPGEELERVLGSVANAAAAAGVDMSDMGSIYNKVASLGKAQNDVLQQVADRGLPIYQALADQLGVTADEVFKMASAGEIGFAQFEQAMSAASGTVAAEMGTTFSGQWANMMASINRIGEGLISGLFPQMKDGVAGLTDVFKDWEVGAKDVGVALGGVAGWVQDNVTWIGPLAAGIAGAAAALAAWVAVTRIAAVVQAVFNAVVTANPLMLIVMAIAAVVAAIVWVATQTTFFQDTWANVTSAIGAAVTWLWQDVILPAVDFIVAAWGGLMSFFQDAWTNVLQPIFAGIGAVFTWVYENIILPVVTGIMLYIGLWAALIVWLWESAVSPVLTLIGEAFTWVWANAIQPAIDFIVGAIQAFGAGIQWLNDSIVQPAFALIGAVFTWLYESVIVPVIDGIVAYFQIWGAIFTWLYTTIIQPTFQALAAAFTWVYENVVRPTIDGIVSAVEWVGSTIQSVFSGIAGFIGAAFQAVLGVVRGPINALILMINGIIDGLNTISVDIPDWVPIVGGQTFGLNIPKIPMLEDGALVKARTGGTIANIGEGRYDEMVVPLSPAVLGQLNQGGGGGVINVYPQPGQSEEEIGRAAARYQNREARRFA